MTHVAPVAFFVYYESMKRLVVELEHLKIKTRLTNEKFAGVKGECEV
jgi:hypothetical protein